MALEPELAVGAQGSCGSKAGRRRGLGAPTRPGAASSGPVSPQA